MASPAAPKGTWTWRWSLFASCFRRTGPGIERGGHLTGTGSSSKRSFLQKIPSQPLNCDELPGASETDELCGPEHAKAAPPALSATTTRLAPTSRKSDVVESDFQLNTCQNLVYCISTQFVESSNLQSLYSKSTSKKLKLGRMKEDEAAAVLQREFGGFFGSSGWSKQAWCT